MSKFYFIVPAEESNLLSPRPNRLPIIGRVVYSAHLLGVIASRSTRGAYTFRDSFCSCYYDNSSFSDSFCLVYSVPFETENTCHTMYSHTFGGRKLF